MCGIAGAVWNRPGSPITAAALDSMRDVLHHRGPDDAGSWLGDGAALASRRLAILDLSERGHMPMFSDDGRYVIVYNGEVYNYRELRPILEGRGYRFRSNSDTEVLLNLYIAEGPAMLHRLNGMFAFAIWDSVERTLFIARDRLGIKPLYYARSGGELYFASEEKALFEAGIRPQFDESTLEELMLFRFVSGDRTPYRGIRRLKPGHYMIWKEGEGQIRRWWNLSQRAREAAGDSAGNTAWYLDTLKSSVELRRISDVPVGILLSGGLDSSSVAALTAEQAGSNVASFTVSFPESEYDESPLARELADRWKLDFHTHQVAPEHMLDRMRRASWLQDEPLAHGNDLHIWSISEYAKPRVTVLLSGEGADETVGGYVRYRILQNAALLNASRPLVPMLASLSRQPRLQKLNRFLKLGSTDNLVLYNSCNLLPEDLAALGMEPLGNYSFRAEALEEARSLYPREPVRQAMYLDQHTFLCSLLDRNDRMTMGASIECRVPFLDYRLVERLATVPTSAMMERGRGKRLLREAIAPYLPESILHGRKWGFSIPWRKYLRERSELREFVRSIPDLDPFRHGPLNRDKLRSVIEHFLDGNDRQELLVRQLHSIAIWHEACCRPAPSSQVVAAA